VRDCEILTAIKWRDAVPDGVDLMRNEAAWTERRRLLQRVRECGSVKAACRAEGIQTSTFYRRIQAIEATLVKDRARCRVLAVDDMPFKLREIQEGLLSAGILVDVAGSADVALRLHEENGYTCVIVDQKMPGMDGLRLAELLREKDPKLPIVLLTSNATAALTRQAFRRGLNDALDYQDVDWGALAWEIVEFTDAYLG
jgi:PleD family two-component response regulator